MKKVRVDFTGGSRKEVGSIRTWSPQYFIQEYSEPRREYVSVETNKRLMGFPDDAIAAARLATPRSLFEVDAWNPNQSAGAGAQNRSPESPVPSPPRNRVTIPPTHFLTPVSRKPPVLVSEGNRVTRCPRAPEHFLVSPYACLFLQFRYSYRIFVSVLSPCANSPLH